MASLVAPLASGVRGAESGTAEFYSRDASTLSTAVFSDADGEAQVTTTSLDSNGGATRYVTESVDVIVRDSTGAIVRSFTWEDYAANVEVRNDGFTGALEDGSTGAGGRTNLDVVLTNLAASFGATDGFVLAGGSPRLLTDVVGDTTAIFFTVTNTAYGAVGNGTTDDTASIQSAINAAVTAGGGIVYFPPGTYKCAGTLTVSSGKIILLGASPTASILKQYTSGTTLVDCTASGVTINGIGFDRNGTGITGNYVKVTANTDVVIFNCIFAGFNGTCLSATTGSIKATNCKFAVTETGGQFSVGTTGTFFYTSCEFTCSAAATGNVFGMTSSGQTILVGCGQTYSTAPATSIYSSAVLVTGGFFNPTAASGSFSTGTSSVFTGVYMRAGGTSGLVTFNGYDYGCRFDFTGNGYIRRTSVTSVSRMTEITTQSIAGTTCTLDTSYGQHEITHTSGASMAFSLDTTTTSEFASYLILTYKNTTGGAITPTFASNGFRIGTAPSVGNNQEAVWIFIGSSSGTANRFIQVGGNPVAYAV